MRHGPTPGNEAHRYVGAIDQPLSPTGRVAAVHAGIHPEVSEVYVTTLKRTHETAAICFPRARQIVCDGLQEMDFGEFAGRTADEMENDPEYRAWVDGWCKGQCPGGESREQATSRICRALAQLIAHATEEGKKRVILVAHGGTMMSAFSTYCIDTPEREYYEWLTGNCGGYRVDATITKGGTLILKNAQQFDDLGFLNEKNELRTSYREMRAALPAEERAAADAAIARKVQKLPAWKEAQVVFAYLSVGAEVDTRALIEAAWAAGKLVAVPRCVPGTRLMEWHAITTFEGMEQSGFGIEEPPARPETLVQPTEYTQAVALVPAFTFDSEGYRLGYGGGFYDTFLPQFAGTSIGLCRASQFSDVTLPHGEFDFPVNIVVTG